MPNRRYKKKKRVAQDNYIPPFDESILAEPVSNLTFRTENTLSLLESADIKTIGDVLKREEKEFYRIFTFKKRNLLDVKGAIRARKLFLKPSPEENKESDDIEETTQPQSVQPKPTIRNANEQNNRDKNTRDDRNNRNDRNRNDRNPRTNVQEKELSPKPQPPQRKPLPQPPADKYIKINKGGKWGFTDRSGKIVVQPLYDEVYNYKDDLCCIEKDELFGFINREGEEVVPIVYELALSFSEGLACVYKGGKCGYINSKNDIIVDFKFDAGTSFEEGSCRIKRDGKWGELKLEDVTHIRWIN